LKFYKILYKFDKEADQESRQTKLIKRSISKALTRLEVSASHLSEIKSQMYLDKSNKEMIKFYLKEYELYATDVLKISDSQVYV
jgi:competence protein ComGF